MKMKLGRKFDPPLILAAGDFIRLEYIMVDGVVRHERYTTIAGMTPDRQMIIDESVVYETEIEGRRAIGVMLLERNKEIADEHPEDARSGEYRR